MPARYPVFTPLADGWRHATIIARVPHNVDCMMLHLSPKHKAADDKTMFRNVALYRLSE